MTHIAHIQDCDALISHVTVALLSNQIFNMEALTECFCSVANKHPEISISVHYNDQPQCGVYGRAWRKGNGKHIDLRVTPSPGAASTPPELLRDALNCFATRLEAA
jgi:hypothetical protein